MNTQYKQIDNEGYVVETYIADPLIELIPNDWVESWRENESFHLAKWDFLLKKWVDVRGNESLLDERKLQKKAELNKICQDSILEGFHYAFNDSIYHFSYDSEAQKNMSDRWNLFQNDMIDSIRITAHNEYGTGVRLEFNKVDFNGLYLDSVQHKENCISKYRDDLLPLIEQALTVEQVEAITWDTVAVEPVPSLVVVEDDNTLDKQVDSVKVEQAQGNIELLQLIFAIGGV